MEDSFDFQIEFQSIPNMSHLLRTPDTNETLEDDLYEELIQGRKKCFRCTSPDCGKTFKFKSEIMRHILIHQRDRPYCCTYTGCRKSFKRPDALENHMRIHTETLPYHCDLPDCDKKYATKAALRYHQIRHQNNRDFKCEFEGCNRSFLTSSQLKQHLRVHNLYQSSPMPRVQEEERKEVELELTGKGDDFSEELLNQGEGVDDNIQWEIRNQENEEENFDVDKEEKFEKIIKYILEENKILKQKILRYEKHTDLDEKGLEIDSQDLPSQAREFSFFDNNQLKFLEFLKARETSEF